MQSTEVIGQQEAWQRLMQLVDEDRIPHALMFVGPQGSGKFALALAFASFLLGEPWAKQWHEMLAKGPYFTMEQWMTMMGAENQQAVIFEAESDALSHRLYLKPTQGGYKVSVIWLPERMNLTCANKMLKLLEEPPQKTVFLLVSEEPERLLETIRSRVVDSTRTLHTVWHARQWAVGCRLCRNWMPETKTDSSSISSLC